MNRLFFVLVSSVALMFAACGDSDDGASPQSNADMEVRTYSELPSCAEKRDGKTAYVVDQEQGYICQNGEWVEDDDVKVVSVTQNDVEGFLTDSRDGQSYRTVTIGTQTWMAENLNYKTDNSYCYDDKVSNCSKYGRFYTWAAAMDSAGKWSSNGKGCGNGIPMGGYGKTCSPTYPVRGVCPTGWHLPTKAEFGTLFTVVGGSSTAGTKLKSTSGWNSSGNGTDAYSFSALPAGYRNDDGSYDYEGGYAYFWSSTEDGSYFAYYMSLSYGYDNAILDYSSKGIGFSVRCVKDYGGVPASSNSSAKSSSSSIPRSSSVAQGVVDPSTVVKETITDSRDGQSYKTVTIGNQTWMAQNLNYETVNSYCYSDLPSNCTRNGRLYTWAAAKTACPTGWHLPTQAEWDTLFTAVGGSSTAGTKLKSTSGWGSGGNGTDAYSFSALPDGYRDYDGYYYYEGSANFWSFTELTSHDAYLMFLYFDFAYLISYSKYYGFSVRCVKDYGGVPASSNSSAKSSSSSIPRSSSVAQGVVDPSTVVKGTITDSRDGQTYKTVVIGTQTWMAQNLNYETANSYCYGNTPSNCSKYGRLYTWAAAMDSAGTWSKNSKGCGYNKTCTPTYPVRGVCPTGWHLPTHAEWDTLFTAVGGYSTAGTKLKSTSGWNSSGNGTDAYSFSALPAGDRGIYGDYEVEGKFALFWSSSEYHSNAYDVFLVYGSDDARLGDDTKSLGFSVRCVKD